VSFSPGALHDHFAGQLGQHWQPCRIGAASLEVDEHTLRLVNTDTTAEQYSNAQIDDYRGLPRSDFPWSPPLTLTVRARFSHPGPRLRAGCDCDFVYQPEASGGPILSGTAGFGFWNDPFAPPGGPLEARRAALPRAIWFFYGSPPSNMKLALDTPGCGWKAATIDAATGPFLLLAPTAPVAVPLMHVGPLYRRLWPVGQRAIRVSEAAVDVDMTAWHTYAVQWRRRSARFLVDGLEILETGTPPRGPLGLVIWLDNQFMVVTPQGRFRHGLLAQPGRQWLEIDSVRIDPG
jgi:hypothetical protein